MLQPSKYLRTTAMFAASISSTLPLNVRNATRRLTLNWTTCVSVQTPDVGAILYLDMLAQSALPNKRPSPGRDLAALRYLAITPRLGEGPATPSVGPRSNTCGAEGSAQKQRVVGPRLVLSLEHPENALVLFDVPTILIVVSGDRHRTDANRFLLPETRAAHLHSRGCSPGGRRSSRFTPIRFMTP